MPARDVCLYYYKPYFQMKRLGQIDQVMSKLTQVLNDKTEIKLGIRLHSL